MKQAAASTNYLTSTIICPAHELLRPAIAPGEDRNTLAGASLAASSSALRPAIAPGEDRNDGWEPQTVTTYEAAPGHRAGRGSQPR
jgi:hypothetical protein